MLDIKDVGIEIDEKAFDKGVSFLKDLRTEKMGYRYVPKTEVKEAYQTVARIMLCEWALYRCKKVDKDQLDSSLRFFIEHKNYLWEVRAYAGKPKKPSAWLLTEAGSPYFAFGMYAYHNTALALKDVNAEQKKDWASELRADILKSVEKDGTWLHRLPDYKGPDTGIGNTIFATANAMLALKALDLIK